MPRAFEAEALAVASSPPAMVMLREKRMMSSRVITLQKPNCPHVSNRTLRQQWFRRHLLLHNSVRGKPERS